MPSNVNVMEKSVYITQAQILNNKIVESKR